MKNLSFILFALLSLVSLGTFAQERGRSFSPGYQGYYYLRTVFTGDELSLEGNGPESTYMNGAAFMSSQRGATGTMWKLVPDPNNRGWYRLQSRDHGSKRCLECNGQNSSVKGGAAFMDNCKNVSGQLWRLDLVSSEGGDHYYRLKSMLHGDRYSLEGNMPDGGSSHNGNSFMDETQNVTGQFWKLIPVE